MLAFIVLLVWGAITLFMFITIIPIVLIGSEVGVDKSDEWFCGGRQLLEKMLR